MRQGQLYSLFQQKYLHQSSRYRLVGLEDRLMSSASESSESSQSSDMEFTFVDEVDPNEMPSTPPADERAPRSESGGDSDGKSKSEAPAVLDTANKQTSIDLMTVLNHTIAANALLQERVAMLQGENKALTDLQRADRDNIKALIERNAALQGENKALIDERYAVLRGENKALTDLLELTKRQVRQTQIIKELQETQQKVAVVLPVPPAKSLIFNWTGDSNGLFHWLGTEAGTAAWSNPCERQREVVVRPSVGFDGKQSASILLDRSASTAVYWNNGMNQHITIELKNGAIKPSHYTLTTPTHLCRSNWKLQGSSDGATFVDLRNHVNDWISHHEGPGQWPVNSTSAFRFLRILVTGTQTWRKRQIYQVPGLSFYLSGIEVYGEYALL